MIGRILKIIRRSILLPNLFFVLIFVTGDAIKNKNSLNKNSPKFPTHLSQNIGKLPKCWEHLAMKNLRFVKA